VTAFTTGQGQALRQLAELWRDTNFCLIGASALVCQVDLPRRTYDLDISVSVSLDDLTAAMPHLKGWKRNPRQEHEWLSPLGIKVDVLPAGPSLLAAGEVVWPSTGARMNLTGLRLALEKSIPLEIEPGLSIPVAPVVVISVLKMISYMDRPPVRERDLHDLAYILDNYVPPADERRFAQEVIDAQVKYEHASAYLLGHDLRALVNDAERQGVTRFIECVQNERHPSGTQARMARLGPSTWAQNPDELLARVKAFVLGFDGPGKKG
jgi:predicted nucleotidyltransferase